ncbi:UvrD-helicase domain-containing protein [Senegalimassilia anaerobia]|uniref:UvrD-like helicase ATP-binding domain-containing protein n=1 Tax=Senegalimassilia anaerobia TaxID=1473216 RepID=A0A369LHK3_9ACTN|nr:UvrD-helicase domain-containing protein [Senegalimassilia anaerobia]RDB57498.1 hypothetical protein C1880_01385 [Senegalimassilia anaerobia]
MAKPNEGVARAALSSSRAIQVIGGPGTGKSQAIVQRAAHLLESGTQPSELLVLAATRSAADALRSRVAACGASGADEVQVCTPMQFFEQVLSYPEARAFTGRNPRLLADFEERILMEDMKTCGLKTKRLREMLKLFFRQWTELGDERDGFLVEDDEHLVHDSIMRHLRLRNAMLPAELGNLTVKFLRDAPDAPAWCRRAHVLADDYQDYARATQLALDLIAREGLMVCGNVNEQVVTPDPYPYPEGLAGFASTHDGTEAIVLTEGLRCPARIAAVGNGLAQVGDMDGRTLVSAGEAAEGGEANGTAGLPDPAGPAARGDLPGDVRFVQWVDPNAEFKGIARYLKHAFAGTAAPAPAAGTDVAPTAPLHPRDVAVVVPNALWGRSIAKVLEVNGMPSDQLVGYHALKGDPRDGRRCADLRAYTLLTLAADPDDAVAWRSWCGFGDYLTHSNHWCRLEDFAEQTGMGVVEALSGLSDFAEPPFAGADVLAARWREAQALLALVRGKRGFALLAACKQPGCDTLPPSFEELLAPLSGTEDATELLARARGRLERRFADTDAVRIALPSMLVGLEFDTVIIAGAVDGFYPGVGAFDVENDEDRQRQISEADRRAWYLAMGCARRTLIVSTFQKDRAETALRSGMQVHRIRDEHGEAWARLAPSRFALELGPEAPVLETALER